MRKIHRDIVSALLVSKDDKILMGMKDPNSGGVYLDCWHIPGGGIDEGEDMLTALKREVLEEVGIDISPYNVKEMDKLGKGSSIKTVHGEKVECEMTFNVFQVDIHDRNASEIKVVLSDDLVKYEWVKISDLRNYKLTPPSMKLFLRLGYIK